jgi:hypothetical protein
LLRVRFDKLSEERRADAAFTLAGFDGEGELRGPAGFIVGSRLFDIP